MLEIVPRPKDWFFRVKRRKPVPKPNFQVVKIEYTADEVLDCLKEAYHTLLVVDTDGCEAEKRLLQDTIVIISVCTFQTMQGRLRKMHLNLLKSKLFLLGVAIDLRVMENFIEGKNENR